MPATDSFGPTPPPPVATQVRELEIWLRVTEGTPPVPGQGDEPATPAVPRAYAGRYTFDRLTAEGVIVDSRNGNLTPHLTPQQANQVVAFLDALLAKAQTSV